MDADSLDTEDKMLEKLRDLLTAEDEDDLPSKEKLAARRREVRSKIEELERRLKRLDADPGPALAEEDEIGDLARRRRELEERLEDMEALDRSLVQRQREAEARSAEGEIIETVAALPALMDAYRTAERELEAARSELEERLAALSQHRAKLRRRGREPAVRLDPEAWERLERLVEELPANPGNLSFLRPPPDEGEEKVAVYEAGSPGESGRWRFEGPWSDEEIRRYGGGPSVVRGRGGAR